MGETQILTKASIGSVDGWIGAGAALITLVTGVILWSHRRSYDQGRRDADEIRRIEELNELKQQITKEFESVREDMRQGFKKVDKEIGELHHRFDDHLNRKV